MEKNMFNQAYKDMIKKASASNSVKSSIPTKTETKDYYIFMADGDDFSEDAAEDFSEAVTMLGGFMYEIPSFEGHDMYGYIISKKKLSKEEIAEIDDF